MFFSVFFKFQARNKPILFCQHNINVSTFDTTIQHISLFKLFKFFELGFIVITLFYIFLLNFSLLTFLLYKICVHLTFSRLYL